MDKFFENCFNLELVLRKDGKTNIRTAIKNIAGIISSNPIY